MLHLLKDVTNNRKLADRKSRIELNRTLKLFQLQSKVMNIVQPEDLISYHRFNLASYISHLPLWRLHTILASSVTLTHSSSGCVHSQMRGT